MSSRYEKYSDPLTDAQKRELKHKEHRPDGEKRHLEIVGYNNHKLVDILCDDNSTIFDKSIAKEEVLRRLVKNQKRLENQKPKKDKPYKGYRKFKRQQKKHGGTHTGSEHKTQYDTFINNGGDPNACPFD